MKKQVYKVEKCVCSCHYFGGSQPRWDLTSPCSHCSPLKPKKSKKKHNCPDSGCFIYGKPMGRKHNCCQSPKKSIKKKDVRGNFKVKVDAKKSWPACMQCLPSRTLDGHLSYNGILVHSRIDCPKDIGYFINEDLLKLK